LGLLSSNSLTKTLDLPSWDPDWTTFPGGSRLLTALNYCANGTTTPNIKFDDISNTLTLGGIFFDEICQLLSRENQRPFLGVSAEAFFWIHSRIFFLEAFIEYPTQDTVTTAFWRTLIASRARNGKEAGEEYEVNFNAFVKI